mmetsp:Transcript_4105/g.12004  ORF Transcript_4105/g.12004 Transcript_4105/m.12004 type:complete len:350 (+) Transcript_4105:275-1324(+)
MRQTAHRQGNVLRNPAFVQARGVEAVQLHRRPRRQGDARHGPGILHGAQQKLGAAAGGARQLEQGELVLARVHPRRRPCGLELSKDGGGLHVHLVAGPLRAGQGEARGHEQVLGRSMALAVGARAAGHTAADVFHASGAKRCLAGGVPATHAGGGVARLGHLEDRPLEAGCLTWAAHQLQSSRGPLVTARGDVARVQVVIHLLVRMDSLLSLEGRGAGVGPCDVCAGALFVIPARCLARLAKDGRAVGPTTRFLGALKRLCHGGKVLNNVWLRLLQIGGVPLHHHEGNVLWVGDAQTGREETTPAYLLGVIVGCPKVVPAIVATLLHDALFHAAHVPVFPGACAPMPRN